jgi:hypothetical protein
MTLHWIDINETKRERESDIMNNTPMLFTLFAHFINIWACHTFVKDFELTKAMHYLII